MTFKPAIWYPISAVLTVANVAAVYSAAAATQPAHATIHAGLAVAFGVWAQRLRTRRDQSQLHAPIEDIEFEVGKLREELSEAQERLDFAERMLAQAPEQQRRDEPLR
jgi:hypothetical protein